VLSSPASLDSFLSEIACETSEKRDQLGGGKFTIIARQLQRGCSIVSRDDTQRFGVACYAKAD